jgi:hypothetical protein
MAPYVGVIGRGGIVARGHGGGFRAEADVRTGRSRRGARNPVLPIRGRPVEEQVPTIITIAPALAQHLRVMALGAQRHATAHEGPAAIGRRGVHAR